MTNSILLTVKKMLGIAEEYHAFDIDILTNINAVFLSLNQFGIGPQLPFQLPLMSNSNTDNDEFGDENEEDPTVTATWDDFLGDQKEYLAGVQTYVYLRTRLLFDPPTNSFLVDAIQKQCEELEWRFTIQPKTKAEVANVDSYKTVYEEEEDVDMSDFPTEPLSKPDEPLIFPESDESSSDSDGEGSLMSARSRLRSQTLFDIFK